jgi:hypothetical protein
MEAAASGEKLMTETARIQAERTALARPVRRRRGRLALTSVPCCLAGIAALWAGAAAGLWFLPFVIAALVALLARLAHLHAAVALAATCGIALVGWGAPLAWMSLTGQPVGGTARVVAALAGLPPVAAIVVTLTLVVAVLQASAGTWLGYAAGTLLGRTAPSTMPR